MASSLINCMHAYGAILGMDRAGGWEENRGHYELSFGISCRILFIPQLQFKRLQQVLQAIFD